MDTLIIKSLEEFVNKANTLLKNSILSAYCFGSAVYDDFHSGYSDLDFFIITENEICEEDFLKFSTWRNELKSLKHPHFPVLEGEIISKAAIRNDIDSYVIYWGTSKDRLNKKYGLSGFSLEGMIDSGYLVYGKDIRDEFIYPDNEEMLTQVNNMIQTIREHGNVTNENIHSVDWFFLICQSIYWLKTSGVTGKTKAAQWVLEKCDYSWSDIILKAIDIRSSPAIAETDENKAWLKNLGQYVQDACNDLETERDKFIRENKKVCR